MTDRRHTPDPDQYDHWDEEPLDEAPPDDEFEWDDVDDGVVRDPRDEG